MTKTCGQCKTLRLVEDFHKHAGKLHGCSDTCKECTRAYALRRNYGMSVHEYREMMTMQASGCAICGEWPKLKALCVDHCHATGKIRGLLCATCNTAIGKLRDDPELIRRAAQYVEDAQDG